MSDEQMPSVPVTRSTCKPAPSAMAAMSEALYMRLQPFARQVK